MAKVKSFNGQGWEVVEFVIIRIVTREPIMRRIVTWELIIRRIVAWELIIR
jgi:hypothetical protein